MVTRGASYLTGAGVLATAVWPLIVVAQGIPEADGGARAEAGLDLRLELDNGDPEFRTGFDLDLITATRTQRLTFSGDFGLVVPLDDVAAVEFNDPSYGVDFLRDTGRLRLSVSADYTATDIDSLRQQEDDPVTGFDESTLTLTDEGTQDRIQAQIALEFGLTGPVGADVRYRFNDVAYTDVTDPDLEDRRLDEISTALRFDVDPTLRFTLDGLWRQTDTEGVALREEVQTNLGAGVTWQAFPDLTLVANVTQVVITTDTTFMGMTTSTEREGTNLTVGVELDRPNGAYSFDASRSLNQAGYVERVELTRDLELARGGALSFSIGATELPSGALEAVGGVTYGRETARGDLSLSLTQDATLNSDDDEVRRTVLSTRYSEEFPQGARWSLSGRLTDSEYINGADADVASARVTVDYTRPLTEVWGLGAGVSWQLTREDGAGDDIDNRVFLSLERRFTLRR